MCRVPNMFPSPISISCLRPTVLTDGNKYPQLRDSIQGNSVLFHSNSFSDILVIIDIIHFVLSFSLISDYMQALSLLGTHSKIFPSIVIILSVGSMCAKLRFIFLLLCCFFALHILTMLDILLHCCPFKCH